MRLAKNDDEYVLNKSSIYVNINATVQVKPVMLALPLFADVQNNPKTNTDWHTIEYKDIRGY